MDPNYNQINLPPHPSILATPPSSSSSPSTFRWTLGFLLVGAAWGLTTPFMRKAALSRTTSDDESDSGVGPGLHQDTEKVPWLRNKTIGIFRTLVDLLKHSAYTIPLLVNVTGSVWFFLLIGQAAYPAEQTLRCFNGDHGE
ncbi:hypothetical protein LTR66_004669 [Elasticomyces elasticus]|nr:hypothetical protein LTR66_004669 [Elasticomyces elasticus]